jgi:hypothetical protein
MAKTVVKQEPTPPIPTIWIMVALVVAYLVWSGAIDLGGVIKPRPRPTPDVIVPDDTVPEVEGREAPAADLLPSAQAVRDRLKGAAAKAAALEGYYAGLAEVLGSDLGGRVTTIQQFRESHRAGLQIRIAGTSLGDAPSVGELVDAVFVKAIGDVPGPLDAGKRSEAARAARAVAWACWAARGGA